MDATRARVLVGEVLGPRLADVIEKGGGADPHRGGGRMVVAGRVIETLLGAGWPADLVRSWMIGLHPDLGDHETPVEAIAAGRGAVVVALAERDAWE